MGASLMNIFLIEDDISDAFLIKKSILSVNPDYKISHYERLKESIEHLKNNRYDIILLDLDLPDSFGLQTLEILRSNISKIPIVVLTGTDDMEMDVKSLRLGAQDYLAKKYMDSNLLAQIIRHAIERHAIEEQLKRRTLELEKANSELKKLSSMKDDFINTVSHELRTPMSIIKMSLTMMNDNHSKEKFEKYFDIARRECDREIDLINDLLDLQKITSNKYDLDISLFDLQSYLNDIVSPFKEKSSFRDQHLIEYIQPRIGDICTDEKCLSRLLNELLNNACKYTDPGKNIEFRAEKKSEDGFEFSISNESSYLPENANILFEKFYRIRKADRWNQGGTGLGLSLAKEMVELLLGSINVKSGDGRIEFVVSIPNFTIKSENYRVDAFERAEL